MSVFRIIDQSHSQSASVGAEVSLYVTAQGDDLTYQWENEIEYEVDGQWQKAWAEISGETDDVYSFTATRSDDGARFRCVVTSGSSNLYSDPIEITISAAPTITRQPVSATVEEGQTATFSIAASGTGTSYQWQVSSDGTTWNDIANATNDTYSFVASLPSNGLKYRCVAYNTSRTQSTTSDPATLTVTASQTVTPPTITTQPSSVTVAEGNSATFTVVAQGSNLSYQWQTRRNGNWFNIDGATGASYTEAGTLALSGAMYQCIVSNSAGAVISNTATLTVTSGSSISTPVINVQPVSISVRTGNTATFILAAAGGGLSYQWQIKQDGTWYNITGATGAAYSFQAKISDNGSQYRCIVTNLAGTVISNVVSLTVTSGGGDSTGERFEYYLVDGFDILPYIIDGGIDWGRNDVDGENAGRVIGNADMQRDRLAIKIRHDITCRKLTTSEIRRILQVIAPEFVTVQYYDPMYGNVAKTMYSNNAKAKLGTIYDDGTGLWENLTFPLIEK